MNFKNFKNLMNLNEITVMKRVYIKPDIEVIELASEIVLVNPDSIPVIYDLEEEGGVPPTQI
mgnify:FL=1